MNEFVHLHAHSEYSLLDGANKIERLAIAAKADKQRALALTDHGNMFGALELYNKCKEQGIKPIIGCEIYISKNSHTVKHNRENGYNHLTLLAKDYTGFQNLSYLTSKSYIEGLSTRPRISWSDLTNHSKGIICLSGCLSGRINELLLEGAEKSALDLVTHLQGVYGKENFLLEIQRNGLTIQDRATEAMYRVHQKTQIPLVATNDIHYHRQEDCEFQDTILCINTGARKAETDRFRFESDTMYFKSAAEMGHTFRELPNSLKETLRVADMVQIDIPQGKYIFPKSAYDDPEKSLTGITNQELFKRKMDSEVYRARLDYELKVICSLGFAEYFLVVRDLIIYARSRGIPVGPGRGSAAGCLISYLLGITSLDPIRHGLLFERFINSERKGLPDIDIDFCQESRKQIIDYLKDKYGDDKVASIITFGKFGAKKALRQVARVLSIPLPESDAIAKKLMGDTIADSVSQDKSLARDQENYAELFKMAQQVEGFTEYAGVHASGIVISSKPIYETVPLARLNKTGHETSIVTQWDMEDCERAGLVKFDILGLETLTVIARIEKLIKQRHNVDISLDKLMEADKFDDSNIYAMLTKGDTEGVFQCYSDSMKRLLVQMKPDRFEDIVSAIALLRPGPLESGIADSYINRKNGKEAVSYLHPDLEVIMKDTYGTMVYQEQIMKLSSALAGFSLNEADELRKAVGKKKPEALAKMKDEFIGGCKRLGKISNEIAESTWDQIEKFGRYGFNMAHSAAYAYLTYYTAYLKVYYPIEFYCANLTQEIGNTDKLKAFLHDAKVHGLNVVKPDLFESTTDFSILNDNTILIGFGAIKGIGSSLEEWCKLRGPFVATKDFVGALALQTPPIISKKTAETLAKSGALDFLNHKRLKIFDELTAIYAKPKATKSTRVRRKLPDGEPQGKISSTIPQPSEHMGSEAGTRLLTEGSRNLLQMEREVFDFYISGHPLDGQQYRLPLASINSLLHGANTRKFAEVLCIIAELDVKAIKSGTNKGKKYARVLVEDQTGQISCMLFSTLYGKYQELLESANKNATPIVIKGRLETQSDQPQISVSSISIFDVKSVVVEDLSIEIKDTSKLEELKALFIANPGDKPVVFTIGNSVKFKSDIFVNITPELLTKLDSIMSQS